LFVYYAQPLSRPKKFLALHVLRDNSGKVGNKVQFTLDKICKALSDRNVAVQYVCSEGDSGCNKQHYEFFMRWYPVRLQGGLMVVLEVVANETMIPVPDFLHLLKNFCNKAKNHLVTICPELLEDILACQDLESLSIVGKVFFK
jgi:hypothetical protein